MLSSAPHLAPLAVGLLAAVVWDVAARRIPNQLCAVIAAGGLVSQIAASGFLAAANGLAAGTLAVALLYPFWSRGGIGGGDVKLAGAVAIWIGLSRLPMFCLAAALAGGLVAFVAFVRSSRAARAEMQANLLLTAVQGTAPMISRTARGRISVPYGVAIAAGAAFTFLKG